MSEVAGPGAPPPEVPDEFAAIYRAAYEEAMRAQSVTPPGTHAEREQRPARPQQRSRPERAPRERRRPAPTPPPEEPASRPAPRPAARQAPERPPREERPRQPRSRAPEYVDEWELPERSLPIMIGTHREERERYDEDASAFERLRDSGWLVAILLVVLALVMVVGAYVVGRVFAGSVGG